MRTLCVAILAVTLMVGSATGAVGQVGDEMEPILSTYVTGTVIGEDHSNADSPLLKSEWLVEWSDPRLPSTMASDLYLVYAPVPDPAVPTAHVYRLDGPDGAWAGTSRGFDGQGGHYEVIALAGEGGSEGLSAMLGWKVVKQGSKPKLEGYIFEFPLPDFPAPIESAAE